GQLGAVLLLVRRAVGRQVGLRVGTVVEDPGAARLLLRVRHHADSAGDVVGGFADGPLHVDRVEHLGAHAAGAFSWSARSGRISMNPEIRSAFESVFSAVS